MLLPEDSRLLKSAKSSVAALSPLQAKPPITPRVHSSSPPPKPLVTKEDDARETRRFQNQIAAAPKPSPPPRVAPANFIGPIAPGARRAAPSNPALGTRPKPAIGPASTFPAANRPRTSTPLVTRQDDARETRRFQNQIAAAPKPSSPPRATPANFIGPIAPGSSGKPIVAPLPKPPAPAKPENKSFWDNATDFVKDHAKDIGHGALDAAGFIPVVGAAADLANAGWYLAEGDKTNAALSAVAAIPGVGDAVAATAIAGKVAVKGAKAIEVASKAVDKADDAVRWGRSALKVEKSAPSTSKTYITYTFRDGENVRYVGRASGKGTPEEVLAQRISKGHRIDREHSKLTAQVEGLPGTIGVQGSRSANKGAEDVLYSYHQTRGDKIVNGKTVTGGASRDNQPLLNRTNPLSNIPWKARTTGQRHVENYARDLKGATPI